MSDVRVLTQNMVREALRDPRFFTQMSEYQNLRAAAPTTQPPGKKCSGCEETRREIPALNQFVEVTLVLAKERARALCAYFGGTPLMVSGTNPRTGQYIQTVLKP